MTFLNNQTCYFILKQTLDGKAVFEKDRDYELFINLIKKYKTRYRVKLYAFCVLPTAFYAVGYAAKETVLHSFVNDVCRSHDLYLNVSHKTDEPIWDRRHRMAAISSDEELVDYIKYVEFIPAKTGLVDSPLQYPWSSCHFRVLGSPYGLIDTTVVSEDCQNAG